MTSAPTVRITALGALPPRRWRGRLARVVGAYIQNVQLPGALPTIVSAAILLIAAAVNFGSIYLRRYYGGRLSLDVQHDLRTGLFGSLSRLDGARQDEIRTG